MSDTLHFSHYYKAYKSFYHHRKVNKSLTLLIYFTYIYISMPAVFSSSSNNSNSSKQREKQVVPHGASWQTPRRNQHPPPPPQLWYVEVGFFWHRQKPGHFQTSGCERRVRCVEPWMHDSLKATRELEDKTVDSLSEESRSLILILLEWGDLLERAGGRKRKSKVLYPMERWYKRDWQKEN